MSAKQGPRWPTGIGNGGLLLVLTALALVMVLVDAPMKPDRGPRRPGVFQFLPPPIGIAQPPAVVAPAERPAAGGEGLQRGHRRHPLRQQRPRPVQPRRPDGRVTPPRIAGSQPDVRATPAGRSGSRSR